MNYSQLWSLHSLIIIVVVIIVVVIVVFVIIFVVIVVVIVITIAVIFLVHSIKRQATGLKRSTKRSPLMVSW